MEFFIWGSSLELTLDAFSGGLLLLMVFLILGLSSIDRPTPPQRDRPAQREGERADRARRESAVGCVAPDPVEPGFDGAVRVGGGE